jgi:Lipocalin-like domain
MKKLIFSAAIAALALSSCKKDNGDEQKAITKESIIGDYKITSVVIKNGAAEVDVFNNTNPDFILYEACQKDDLFKLKASDVFEYMDAGTACSGDRNYTDSWSLNGNAIMVGEEASGIVTSLTSKQMIISSSYTEDGITISETITFARQ